MNPDESLPTDPPPDEQDVEESAVEDTQVEDTAPEEPETSSEPLVVSDEHRRAIEAIVMVAEEPVAPHLLAQLTDLPVDAVEQVCAELAAEYEADARGFSLVRVAGGYRFQTVTEVAPYVERFVLEGQTSRLSAAALETLAIVAYKQPISRAQVAGIRGVNVDAVLRTLQHRGYVDEIARDPGPGQAVLFGTTPLFLDKMGLDSLGQLPSLGDFMPAPEVVEILEQSLRPERLDLDEAVVMAEETVSAAAAAEPDGEESVEAGRGEDGLVDEEATTADPAVEGSAADAAADAAVGEDGSPIVEGDGAVIIDLRGDSPQPASDPEPVEALVGPEADE